MKTLILYATKYGAAREIAERLLQKMPGAVLCDLKEAEKETLSDYETVIIGSAVYAGFIRKEAKAFLAQNAETLKTKKLGLFLCGLQAAEEKKVFASNFAPEVLAAAKAARFLGGIYDPKKAGFLERAIIKAASKLACYTDKIDDKGILEFAEKMGE
ncbi:MAG: flavodoxin domain-containing protein [Lachnospiraceae bacterium]|nr:flavodoxin domain-containing protein [Lachnospiraceae bacterium]